MLSANTVCSPLYLERAAANSPFLRTPACGGRWWQMPEICIMPSIPLLASFQQLTELGESSHILQDLSRNQGRGPVESQYSHLKDILETWRLRTPNEWERVSTWSDIMLWRNVIYNIVINAFQSVKDVAPHLHQLGYRDRAWSVNRFVSWHRLVPRLTKQAV